MILRLCSASFGIADSEKKKEEEDEDEDEDEDEEEEEDDYRNLKKKIITRFDARGGEAAEKKKLFTVSMLLQIWTPFVQFFCIAFRWGSIW